jgi:WD40 repeat protein
VLALDCSTGVITCHSYRTNFDPRVEILMGFSSGDLVMHSSIISKGDYRDSQILKFNKERGIENKPVTSIAWCKDEHFLVAHANGNIYLYDRTLTKEHAIQEKCTSRFDFYFKNQVFKFFKIKNQK